MAINATEYVSEIFISFLLSLLLTCVLWPARAHQPQHAICGIEIPSALDTNRAAPSSRTGPASSSFRQRTDLNPSGRTGAASTICNDGQAPTAEMAVTPPSIRKSAPTTYAESSDAR